MLAHGTMLEAYHTTLKSRCWRKGDLLLGWPVDDQGELVHLAFGQAVIVEVWPEHDALYTVETVVKGARREVPDHIVLEIRGEWQRVQRREHVRFPARIAPSSALAVTGELRSINASIRDLSAAGLRVWSGQELVVGEELRLAFRLPDGGSEIDAHVRIERVEPFAYQNVTLWEAGCSFDHLSPAIRERIVRYIFAEQRQLAQRRREARQ
jgi:c-di-GMP-binding flagellar brake protein YcgR